MDWHVYFYGAYERYLLFLLRDIAKGIREPVFVDVGANVGQHTLFMAPRSARVHSFEPYAPVRAELERAISYNRIQNVSIHPVALGSHTEDLLFYAPDGANLGVGSFVDEKYRGREDLVSTEKLPVVRGDEYFDMNGIGVFDILKIDVEGFEAQALTGLQAAIARSRPYIIMEFSVTTQASYADAEAFIATLPRGYSAYTIIGDQPFIGVFNLAGYRLKPFDFGFTMGNVLLAPAEKLGPLQR